MCTVQGHGLIRSLSGGTVRPELVDPGGLTRGEFIHAGATRLTNQELFYLADEVDYSLIRVVHEVVNGVDTRVGRPSASILPDGASMGAGSLSWSIGNLIVGGTTATLKGVEETKPVTNFMGCSLVRGQRI